ncbi:hypothetical protein N476_17960 [Pseudoalteromonas luteoviolacea H33]|uniref:Uncharacterized protein n=1 Tax=Pseudoalteromonas luteoviolacea H33 TaxID=1365251 RepID=A0A161Y3W7_9GAMM|nr:hypothetical protein N476_17960 [Pseudoalteromonas luteoviolacea H33]KZN74805.1 hypothetical protein N477_21375 [Pseudoalteromonas luteoviolacea H33-S]
MDERVERLSDNCRKAITCKYIKVLNKGGFITRAKLPAVQSVDFWVVKAECALLN